MPTQVVASRDSQRGDASFRCFVQSCDAAEGCAMADAAMFEPICTLGEGTATAGLGERRTTDTPTVTVSSALSAR